MNKITHIQPVSGYNKYRVSINGKFAFVLYKGELLSLGIHAGLDLSDELLKEIDELVYTRAIDKLNMLFAENDRTRKQVYEIFLRNEYPKDIIDRVIDYGIDQGFIDDEKYAVNYVSCYRGRKSIQTIKSDLIKKGVPKEYVDSAVSEMNEEDDLESIMVLLAKKWPHNGELSYEERNKFYYYLGNKGYSFDIIKQAMEIYENNLKLE